MTDGTPSGLPPRFKHARTPEEKAARKERDRQRRRARERERRARKKAEALEAEMSRDRSGANYGRECRGDLSALLSLCHALADAQDRGRALRPHPGDEYTRRKPCTAEDLAWWRENDPERLKAYTEACVALGRGDGKDRPVVDRRLYEMT